MKEHWNKRFNTEKYVFGTEPNEFFKNEIDKITPGKALFIAGGEGRNAVYAAKLGWQTDVIDYSDVAQKKALKLSSKNNVSINYKVADIFNFKFPHNYYDLIVNINFHCYENSREDFNKRIISALKPNGKVILQVFDKEQIKMNSGGPKDLNLLYTLEDIVNGFYDLEFEYFAKETDLRFIESVKKESVVIRFVGKRI